MKNIFKLSGIIVMAAVMGFSFATCSNGSTDEDDSTYTAAIFLIDDTDYMTAFGGPAPTSLGILPGDKDTLIAKVNTAMGSDSIADKKSGNNLSYAEVEGAIMPYVVTNRIQPADKTKLVDALKSKGYVVGTVHSDGKNVIFSAYQE